jgi:hypothetical protein
MGQPTRAHIGMIHAATRAARELLEVAEAGLLDAQQEVFANPPPLVPSVNEPVPRQ